MMRLKQQVKKIFVVSLVLVLAFPYFVEVNAALTATWDNMDDLIGVDGHQWTALLPTWDNMDDLTGADDQTWNSENAAWDLTVNNSDQHEGSGCLDFAIESTDPDNGNFSISGISEDFSSYRYLKFWVKTPALSSFRFEIEDSLGHTAYWNVSTSSTNWEEIIIDLSNPDGGSINLSYITKVAFSGLERPGSGVYHYLFDVIYLAAWDLTVNTTDKHEGSGCLDFIIMHNDIDGEFGISGIDEDFSDYNYLNFWVKTPVPSSFRLEIESPSGTAYWNVSTSSTNWEEITIYLPFPMGGSVDLSHIEKLIFSSLDSPSSGIYHYLFDYISLKKVTGPKLGEDGYIEGKVVDEDGIPIEGATVVACCYKKRYTTTTDADGNYKLPSPIADILLWDDMDDKCHSNDSPCTEEWKPLNPDWELQVNNSDKHEGSGSLDFAIEPSDADNGSFGVTLDSPFNFLTYEYLTFWVKCVEASSIDFKLEMEDSAGHTSYWNVKTSIIKNTWKEITLDLLNPSGGDADLSEVKEVRFSSLDKPASGEYHYRFDNIELKRMIEEEGLFYDPEGTKYRVEAYKEAENGDLGYKREMKYVELNLDDHIKTVNFSLTKETESKAKYKELYTIWMEIGDVKAVNEYTLVLFDVSKRYWEHAQTKMIPDKVYFQVFREGNFIEEYILDLCDNTFYIQEVLKVEILAIEDRNHDGEFEVQVKISSRERPTISLSNFKLYSDVAIKEKTIKVGTTTTTIELDGKEFKAKLNGDFKINLNEKDLDGDGNIFEDCESFSIGDSFATITGECINTRSYTITGISDGSVTLKPDIRELMNYDDFELTKMEPAIPVSGKEVYMFAVIENVGNYKASDVVVSVDHFGYTLLNYCDISSNYIYVGDMEPKGEGGIKKVILLRLKAPIVNYEEYHPITISVNYKMKYTNEEGKKVKENFQEEFKQDINVYPKTVQLDIKQFVSYKKLILGEESDVTVTVENTGDLKAYDLEIICYTPSGLELVEGEASKTLSELSPGESTQFSYRIKAKEIGEYELITKVRYKDERGESYEQPIKPERISHILVYKEFPRLNVRKNIDKTNILVNQHIVVVIVVTNTGNKPAKDVVIIDTIPESFSLESSKEEEITGDVNVFKISRMNPNEKKIFSYIIKADEPGKYTLKGCKVRYSDYENNYFEYEAPDVNIDVSGIPKLNLEYSISRESVQDGELLTVIGRVSNIGNGLAKNISLDHVYSKGELVNGDLKKEIENLKQGEYQKFKFTVRVPVSSTAYDFRIDVDYNYYDILGNAYPGKQKFIQKIDADKPKIEISRTVEKMVIKKNKYYIDSGYSFIISLTFVNTGTADAVDLVLEEKLPEGFEVINGTNKWEGDLKRGESKTITYTALGYVGGNYSLTPEAVYKDKWGVSYSTRGKTLGFTLRGLKISKSASKNKIKEGDTVDINISIKNYDDSSVTDIVVEDSIPEGFELVEGETTVKKDLLKPNETFSFTYKIKARRSGNYTLSKAKVSWKNPYGESRQIESAEYKINVEKRPPPATTTPPPTTPVVTPVYEKYVSKILLLLVVILLLIIAIIGIRTYSKRRFKIEEEGEEELMEGLELPEESEISTEELPEETEEKTPEEIFKEISLPEFEEEEEKKEEKYPNAPGSIKKILEWQEKEEKRKRKEEKKETEEDRKRWFDMDYDITEDMTPKEVLKGKKKKKEE